MMASDRKSCRKRAVTPPLLLLLLLLSARHATGALLRNEKHARSSIDF